MYTSLYILFCHINWILLTISPYLCDPHGAPSGFQGGQPLREPGGLGALRAEGAYVPWRAEGELLNGFKKAAIEENMDMILTYDG